jgi:F-type H+-transporting ATPase subunit b
MEQLLHAFGIDLRLITIQIINFVVLAGILSYLLYKPVLKMLNDREEKIKQGIADAEAAAVANASAQEKKQEILAAAQKTAEEMDARAKAHAKESEERILAQAQVKASELVKGAEEKGALLKEQALKESEAEIAKLAILAAEKILKGRSS